MLDPVRQEIVTHAHTIVVKVGTNVLTDENGALSNERVRDLAQQLSHVRQSGRNVVLVSSGAIGAGVGRLGLPARPVDLRHLQACAAVGQSFLMRAYEEELSRHGIATAQILLTAEDFDTRQRYLNVRNTLLSLLEWDCLPIINENDTLSTEEICFSDNDQLAAHVTNLLQAPLLLLLSNVDGLYERVPEKGEVAFPLATVPEIDERIQMMAGPSRSSLGLGGMQSKLQAARHVTAAGESVIIANGAAPGILERILNQETVGTVFLPQGGTLSAWKRWLGYTARPRGNLTVDAGAHQAVRNQGRSLLAIGITQVQGTFRKGDVIALCDPGQVSFARGLTNYSSEELTRICGMRTGKIAEVLGTVPYEEVVHRDNLVIVI